MSQCLMQIWCDAVLTWFVDTCVLIFFTWLCCKYCCKKIKDMRDLIHYDHVNIVNSHNEIEGWVPIVQLSNFSHIFIPFWYLKSHMSLRNVNFSEKLPNICAWACICMFLRSIDFTHGLSFGSSYCPFLCAGSFVSDQMTSIYQQALEINANL